MKFILLLLLKSYLFLHERVHERVFHTLAIRGFDGLHPKNIFNYRTEFFLENVTPSDSIIDIACGTGRILGGIAPSIKFGLGLDYDSKNIDKALKNFSQTNLKFLAADIFSPLYSELKNRYGYNIAIYSHILEHVEDVPALLLKVAAPEILICVPSQENWYRQTLKFLGLDYKTDPTHFREYTREMLRAELKSAKYEITYLGFNSEGEIVCRARSIP